MKRRAYRRPRRSPWFVLFGLVDDSHPFVTSPAGGVGAVVDVDGAPYVDAPPRSRFREAYRRARGFYAPVSP